MDNALWIPLAVLFITALITALVKRYTKDPCLKLFQHCFVIIRLTNGRWLWGRLTVFSNALELSYTSAAPLDGGFDKKSYVFYEQNFDLVDRVLRPFPAEGTREYDEWMQEVWRLQHPSVWRRLKRKIRNMINILRDAFAQSIVMIFGAAKRTRVLSRVQIGDEKVGEVGRSLINVVPNAYEPILEKYLGRKVVVESVRAQEVLEQVGVLQEYSAKYVTIRGVRLRQDLPPLGLRDGINDDEFDVIFPRQTNSVRHLVGDGR